MYTTYADRIANAMLDVRNMLRDLCDHSDTDWRNATCGECAWRMGRWINGLSRKGDDFCYCRNHGWGPDEHGRTTIGTPACPAFVRRTEEGS